MQIINFLTFAIFNRLFLSESAALTKEAIQNNHKHSLELTYQDWQDFSNRSLLESDIPTQITVSKNNIVQHRWEQKVAAKFQQADYQFCNYENRSKTLLKVAKESFEQRTVNAFIARLSNFNSLQQELSKNASNYVERTINICSSFKMSEQQQKQFVTTIRDIIDRNVKVNFTVSQKLNDGIELRDRGYKIFGNLKYYITELELQQRSNN